MRQHPRPARGDRPINCGDFGLTWNQVLVGKNVKILLGATIFVRAPDPTRYKKVLQYSYDGVRAVSATMPVVIDPKTAKTTSVSCART